MSQSTSSRRSGIGVSNHNSHGTSSRNTPRIYGTKYMNSTRTYDTVCSTNCTCSQKQKTASTKSVPGYEYVKNLNLSKGNFSSVHLYRNNCSRQMVAIKAVPYIYGGQNIYHAVADEVDLVKNIKHPNIATYYDFFVNGNRFKLYIVMEYAKRGSLRQLLNEQIQKRKWFPQNFVLQTIHDVISGMNYLNSKQVVHCDLKPENILVGDNGRMKICDFGTAHSIHDKSKAHTTGTTSYMAPELFDGMLPDEKSEIWSLGIIFHELCTFNHPFYPFTTNEQLISKIKAGLFKSLNCRLSGYSYRMQELLEFMLQTNPAHRKNLVGILRHELFATVTSKSY